MKKRQMFLGAFLLTALFVSTASAEVYTGSQIGEVTYVDGSDSYLVTLWGVEVGDEVTVDYMYDSDYYGLGEAYLEWHVKVQGYDFGMHAYENEGHCGMYGHCLVDADWPTLTADFIANTLIINAYGTFDNLFPKHTGMDFDYEGITSGILDFELYDFEGTYYETMTMSYNASTPVVPEPISSTLFLAGGVTLGFRRFMKKV